MRNVEYVCSRKGRSPYTMEYLFKIAPDIADLIRKYTKYSKEKLLSDLTDDNEVILRTGSLSGKGYIELDESVIKTIEWISNSVDEETFWNHLLTDNGKRRYPADVHDLMKTEYGLTDENTEWWVAHFFINLSCVIYSL